MVYTKSDNLELFNLSAIKKIHKDVSFPKNPSDESLEKFGYFPVEETPAPSVERDEIAELQGAKKVGDDYQFNWVVRSRTQAEIDELNDLLISQLAGIRYDKEVGGVDYLGKAIQTDRETRANWIGILISAQGDANYTVKWKTIDNSFVEYDANQAIGAALTVSGHVQKCFAAEEYVKNNIASYDDYDAVAAAFNTAFDSL